MSRLPTQIVRLTGELAPRRKRCEQAEARGQLEVRTAQLREVQREVATQRQDAETARTAEARLGGELEALRRQNREPLDRLRPREEMQVAQPATR